MEQLALRSIVSGEGRPTLVANPPFKAKPSDTSTNR
jgi:hypothetical protein